MAHPPAPATRKCTWIQGVSGTGGSEYADCHWVHHPADHGARNARAVERSIVEIFCAKDDRFLGPLSAAQLIRSVSRRAPARGWSREAAGANRRRSARPSWFAFREPAALRHAEHGVSASCAVRPVSRAAGPGVRPSAMHGRRNDRRGECVIDVLSLAHEEGRREAPVTASESRQKARVSPGAMKIREVGRPDPSSLARVLGHFEQLEEVAAALVQASSTMDENLAADARELQQQLAAAVANARMRLGAWPPPPRGKAGTGSPWMQLQSGGPVVSGG